MVKGNDPIESGLQALFSDPEPAFLRRLEVELAERGRDTVAAGPHGWTLDLPGMLRRRAVSLALAAVLLVAGLVLVLGPSQVLAQIGRIFGYLPGVGFLTAETDQVQALVEPVTDQRNGLTLTVENIIVLNDRTLVTLSISGIVEEELQNWVLNYSLGLADGTPLEAQKTNWAWDWQDQEYLAEAEFEALPEDTRELALTWSANHTADWQSISPAWSLRLPLRSAGLSEILQSPRVYSPEGAADSHHGVSLTLLDVSQHTDRMALNLEITRTAEGHRLPIAGSYRLKDNLGNEYAATDPNNLNSYVLDVTQTPGQEVDSYRQTLAFTPGGLDAQTYTFEVEGMNYAVDAYQGYVLDLGADPQVGDELALDWTIDVDGIPVRVERAKVVEVDDGDGNAVKALEFRLAPLPEQEGRRILSLHFFGQGQSLIDAGSVVDPATGISVRRILVEELDDWGRGGSTGKLRVRGYGARIQLEGPWVIQWEKEDP